MTKTTDDDEALSRAYAELEHELPARLARSLQWLRDPAYRWVRIPLGLLLIGLSFLWFLPVVGIEMLPVGLLLIAQDVPFLRGPVGRLTLRAVHGWRRLRNRYRRPTK